MCEHRGGEKPRCAMKVKARVWRAEVGPRVARGHHRPIWIFLKDLSKSTLVVTRKVVIYGCAE